MEVRHGKTTIIRRAETEALQREISKQTIRAKDPFTIVIFGASGDLAHRKLIPALYHLDAGGFLPERYAVVGLSRTPMSDEAYRDKMAEALKASVDGAKNGSRDKLLQALHYVPGDNDDAASFARLKQRI